MLKSLVLSVCCVFLATGILRAHTYTEQEGRAAWEKLRQQPVNEGTFRQVCDLAQDIGQTNLNLSYEILSAYLPMIERTGNRRWAHILLMGWAKAKASMNFFEEGEALYRRARANAGTGSRFYREAVVATVLMYLEWGKADSLEKYLSIGERESEAASDKESLSFIYTFKAMSRMADTAAMRYYLENAMQLGAGLPDKNALFTALYNYADIYCQNSPQKQVTEFQTLLELAKDSTLSHKPRLYERTAFCFRNPAPSVYYELMQVNLLLLDYDNAWKFMELFYDATIKPHPASVQAPYFNAEMAIVKAYQGDYVRAKVFLDTSRILFHLPEDRIPYISYFIAAGMMAEHEGRYDTALRYYGVALKKGNTEGLYLMPPAIYYAHALLLNKQPDKAAQVLAQLTPLLKTRTYSAIGFYYYRNEAELLKARGDYRGYAKTLETFYAIKDSLGNLNHYRAIQEIEAAIRIRDKEQQIIRLDQESSARLARIRQGKNYFFILAALSAVAVLLLIAYSRNQYLRKRQAQEISRQNEILQAGKIRQLQEQHRMEVMQGTIDAEESERRKIADQLHDEVGSMLSVATLHISSSVEKGGLPDQVMQKMQKALQVITTVAGTIRDLSHRLTPLIIERLGFQKALEDMAETINLSGKMTVDTIIVGFDDMPEQSPALLNDLYRIIQELLHNILKHSRASSALLEVVLHEDHISVLVEDNGVGLPENAIGKGKGLKGIQSRVAYLHGRMQLADKPEAGALIVLEIPLRAPDDHTMKTNTYAAQIDHSG